MAPLKNEINDVPKEIPIPVPVNQIANDPHYTPLCSTCRKLQNGECTCETDFEYRVPIQDIDQLLHPPEKKTKNSP